MKREEFRKFLQRQPFVPIRVHFTDGTSYDVKRPEMALLTRSIVEIGTEGKEGSGIADGVAYCSLVQIVRVENLDGARRAKVF